MICLVRRRINEMQLADYGRDEIEEEIEALLERLERGELE